MRDLALELGNVVRPVRTLEENTEVVASEP